MPSTSESPSTIALVGNPNAGKTTLFNALTGKNQQVGNYSGVTVEVKSGETFTPHGRKLRVLDLPGCYSLKANSPDEKVALDALIGALPGETKPDLVVCVVDASNLERHLQLTLQVIELGIPCILALNMVDVAEKSGLRLDPVKISEELGIPVVPMQANARKGIVELKQALRLPHPTVVEPTWISNSSDPETGRRDFISKLCELAARRPDAHQQTLSDRIDSVLLHPVYGWLCMALIFFSVFWSIFSFAQTPMGWIENGQALLADFIQTRMADGDLRSLLIDGILGGVGGLIMFLPQIVLLFLHRPVRKLGLYGPRGVFDGWGDVKSRPQREILPAAFQLLRLRDSRRDGHPHDPFRQGKTRHHLHRPVDELLSPFACLFPAYSFAAS
jgi:ferrous iron transport protein B